MLKFYFVAVLKFLGFLRFPHPNFDFFLLVWLNIKKSSFDFSMLYLSQQDEIGLKEWALSLRSAHKRSLELLGSMAKKAGKIYGTDEKQGNNKNMTMISTGTRNTNGN